MPYLLGYYIPVHHQQPLPGDGCTWTSGANGARAVTSGHVDRSAYQIHALVKNWEETSPGTSGWSLPDLDLAMSRLAHQFPHYAPSLGFQNRSGTGWRGILEALNYGLYVVAQGDSDRFGNNTCSGAFNGSHAIGIHPVSRMMGSRQRWIDDPICANGRWENEYTLRAYVEKLNSRAQFAVFTHRVPRLIPNAPDTSVGPQIVTSWPAPTERNAMIASAYPGHVMRLIKGQPLFRHPGGPVVTHMSAAGAIEHVGSAGGGWSAVQVATKAPYADGKTRPTILYVPNAAGPVI